MRKQCTKNIVMTRPGQENNAARSSAGEGSAGPRFSRLKRCVLVAIVLVLMAFAFIKACLPGILERIIYEKIEAAGFHDVELRVQSVGLSSAGVESVSVAEQHWSLSASRVLVEYALFDLIAGRLKGVTIEGMEVDLKLPNIGASGPDLGLMWLHSVPTGVENLGSVRAHGATLSIERGGHSVTRVMDIELTGISGMTTSALLSADDFKLGVDLRNKEMHAELFVRLDDVEPDTVIPILDAVMNLDGPLLPSGLSLSAVSVNGSLSVDKGDISPVKIETALRGLVYEQKDQPLKIVLDETRVELVVGRDQSVGAGLKGAVHGLGLHVQKGDEAININDASMVFDMGDGRFEAEGSMKIDGNEIPLSYQHALEYFDDGWELNGSLVVDEAHLNTPWENAAILVEDMEGKSLGGKVSAKMSFSLGKDRGLQASLQASLREGTLALFDEQPFIEGIDTDITLDSLMHKSTAEFHRVTARKATAFDVTMSDLAMDYKIMENGDVSLRDVSFKAMGGEVLIDDFILPGGDADYTLLMRFKKLELALLAELFPVFSGRISGSMDGLLPIERSHGEIIPGKGELYLTPNTKGKLRYDAGESFSAGLNPKTEHYQRMKMVEQSLQDLDLKVLSIRLFDPQDGDKALVLRLEGHAPRVEGSPPIHLNVNGFKPDDETVDFFDLLLRHRDRLDFGL